MTAMSNASILDTPFHRGLHMGVQQIKLESTKYWWLTTPFIFLHLIYANANNYLYADFEWSQSVQTWYRDILEVVYLGWKVKGQGQG